MKLRALYFLLMLLLGATLPAASFTDNPEKPAAASLLSSEEKIWGLMQVWAEVKFNFVYFDQVPDLDWDGEARACIPAVLAAQDLDQYNKVLQALVARLDDGHTMILTAREISRVDMTPPLELEMLEGKIIITRVGDTAEIRELGIIPGLQLVAVDGRAADEYLRDDFIRYYRGGTEHWGNAFGLFRMLLGPPESTVELRLADATGQIQEVNLTRTPLQDNGRPFLPRFLDFPPLLEVKKYTGGIVYFRIATFGPDEVADQFNHAFDALDLSEVKGMIIDIRYNMGGSSNNAYSIISRLIDEPIPGAIWKTRQYRPAHRAWGQDETWFEGDMGEITPHPDARYGGPLVVLIGNHTFSAAEDFLVPLDHMDRALLIGNTTGGSTGNPLMVRLPGGAVLRVCSKRDTYPDGTEFVGTGIAPDIAVQVSREDVLNGRDKVLETALSELMSR